MFSMSRQLLAPLHRAQPAQHTHPAQCTECTQCAQRTQPALRTQPAQSAQSAQRTWSPQSARLAQPAQRTQRAGRASGLILLALLGVLLSPQTLRAQAAVPQTSPTEDAAPQVISAQASAPQASSIQDAAPQASSVDAMPQASSAEAAPQQAIPSQDGAPATSRAEAAPLQANSAQAAAPPTIRVPYFPQRANPGQGAIFWLGKVDTAANYSDVRIAYDDNALLFILHIFDRRAWYDTAAGPASDLAQYDSVSVYLDTQSDLAAPLGAGSRRFDGALAHWQARANYQRAYTYAAGAWQPAPLAFETSDASVRGESNNDADDRGWTIQFRIPFASLGLSGAPPQGSTLRMALFLHDRDEAGGGVQGDQTWPPAAAVAQPATWGRVSLGMPAYKPPTVAAPQQVTIRQGVNGAVVPDAGVGGHSICGAAYYPEFFSGWGSANYAGYDQLNIQNQWDVADWPCFSRYYITFPLDALPKDTGVVSATLTMYLFGNAGYKVDDAQPSYIQVARVAEDWSEQTVTWNNGPGVMENYTWSWVEPLVDPSDRTAHAYTWDLARAVADARAAGEPLRLVMYSTDGDYHSGKYFWTSNARDEGVRPSLDIVFGSPGYSIEAVAVRPRIRGGETAEYELAVNALRAGETATIEVGASTPAGLEVSVSPAQVSAPGGKATITLTDKAGTQDPRAYRVPVTVRSGSDTRTTELFITVNGSAVYLPAIRR